MNWSIIIGGIVLLVVLIGGYYERGDLSTREIILDFWKKIYKLFSSTYWLLWILFMIFSILLVLYGVVTYFPVQVATVIGVIILIVFLRYLWRNYSGLIIQLIFLIIVIGFIAMIIYLNSKNPHYRFSRP